MTSRPCNHGMRCFNETCYFKHPVEWDPRKNQYCPNKSECILEGCILKHPNRLCNRYHCDQHICTFQHVCRLEEAGWKCPQKWDDVNSGKIVCRLAHDCFDELENNVPNSAIAEFLQIVIPTVESAPNEINESKVEEELDEDMIKLRNGGDWGDI